MEKELVLVLDEEAHIQWTLKTFLVNEKYNVIPVSTTRLAVQYFSELEVAGLITEYWVQGSCVLETVRELKKKLPETYVMVLTNYNVDESEYRKITDAGIDDFFSKPVSSERILFHLRNGLRRRRISIEKRRFEEALAGGGIKTGCA